MYRIETKDFKVFISYSDEKLWAKILMVKSSEISEF